MAVSNRAARIATLHKVAKKHYQPVKPPLDRSVLEHMLYACCLEDSQFDAADIAFARLQQFYFDWNEVRVTTAIELSEVMHSLREPMAASTRLKRTLHSMFEANYTFDIDPLRRDNLGKAIQRMEKYKGITPFVVSYVAQNALGGHAIPVDNSLINLLFTVGIIDEKEAESSSVPGLDRAVTKSRGVEFFSLVHQMAVAWVTSPFNKDMQTMLLAVDRDARERFPKRTRSKDSAAAAATKETGGEKKRKSVSVKPAREGAPSKPATEKPGRKNAPARKSGGTSSGATGGKFSGKSSSGKSTGKKADAKGGGKKQQTRAPATKSPAKRLARKKPR